MTNTQLQTLLARTPLSHEDIYNVSVIFEALPVSRQTEILNNWEKYVLKLVAERQRLDSVQQKEMLKTLKQANTLLDMSIARMQEKNLQKEKMKKQTQEELDSALTYEMRKKDILIHSITSKK